MINHCELKIDGKPYSLPVEGEFFWGKDELLFPTEDSLISKTSWKEKGYTIVKAFSDEELKSIKNSISKNIINILKSKDIEVDESSFDLEKYHNYVTDKEKHNEIIFKTREFKNENFDFNFETLAERFSEIVGYKLSSFNKELGTSHVQVRISRPNSYDINPPHRDGYLSYYKNILNVWIPIVGCNELSSLPVLPASHLLRENQILRTETRGAKINGNVYNVPCILETSEGFDMVRPNPKEKEALIFTPYLIHGAAFNTNMNITRVALELRFTRQ